MTPESIAEQLLIHYGQPDFEAVVMEVPLTTDVIAYLKARVQEERLSDAHQALHIATVTHALIPYLQAPEAKALAYWAKGSALLHLVRYQEALEDYQQAAAIYERFI